MTIVQPLRNEGYQFMCNEGDVQETLNKAGQFYTRTAEEVTKHLMTAALKDRSGKY